MLGKKGGKKNRMVEKIGRTACDFWYEFASGLLAQRALTLAAIEKECV